jgi:hypothetical protein
MGESSRSIKDMAKDANNVLVYAGIEHVSVALSPNQVALVIDVEQGGEPSSTGKTMLVASSCGAQPIADGITYSLNVMKKLTFSKEEIAQMLATR